MIKFLPQILMTIFLVLSATYYLIGIKRGTVKPILATRIFISFAMLLSLLTNYKETGFEGLFANALNILDVLYVFVLLIVVLFRKDTRRKFTKFEKYCLYVVVFIFINWMITGQNVLSHLLIQGIIVIAYLPTVIHLWKVDKSTESLSAWIFDFLASLFGTIEPLRTMAFLPLVYSIRSTISTFVVVLLILRLKFKKK